jgi:CspA family cold shock protein
LNQTSVKSQEIIFGIIFEVKEVLIINYITIMSKGTVKFFNDAKGFGFITEEGLDKDHFVHISGLIDEIREGDAVEFELTEGKKGLNAINVQVI